MEINLSDIYSKNLLDINLKIKEKEITSILGTNEGKTTELMEVICGLKKITGGIIKYQKDEVELNIDIKKDIYYLKDNYEKMLFNINIKEDIRYYLGCYDNEKLNDLLKGFNLDIKILENNYLELSSSEIRKILLIIGLMSSAKIIILENPTIKLDNKSIQTLIKNLKKIKRENKIVIISSYNTNFLLEISDRLIVVDNKKIICDGNKFEVLSNEKILDKINLKVPDVIQFINKVKELKNIKIGYRDNINDLIKDIFRYAK